MYKLYHYPLCPFSRIVRIYLNENKIPYEEIIESVVEISQVASDTAIFFSLPILVNEKDDIVGGYRAILEYIENHHKKNLFGKTAKDKILILQVLEWFDTKFYAEVYQNLIYEKIIKKQMNKRVAPDSNAIRNGIRNISYHLQIVSKIFEKQDWIVGKSFSVADIAVAAHVSCIDYLGTINWDSDLEFAKEWYIKIKSRPSFSVILQDKLINFEPSPNYNQLDF